MYYIWFYLLIFFSIFGAVNFFNIIYKSVLSGIRVKSKRKERGWNIQSKP